MVDQCSAYVSMSLWCDFSHTENYYTWDGILLKNNFSTKVRLWARTLSLKSCMKPVSCFKDLKRCIWWWITSIHIMLGFWKGVKKSIFTLRYNCLPQDVEDTFFFLNHYRQIVRILTNYRKLHDIFTIFFLPKHQT